ncbi:pyridoxamine 5'-phosphate oxidase family protein [Psychrobacter sp.]|uniref:pyridoxamine 5'-phosphate oxidase family protein n=1 Tax=Psychrobacter sp. TaxID=56811 RepID=UPI0025D7B6C2|nr:pyridoxamine 5'-phosphate oxidase family protein [Psychrobacter sp.]
MDKIKRLADKADYSLQTAYDILDANTLCHIAFIDDDRPMSIPMAYWRIDNSIYFHAANKGRFEKSTIGKKICVSVATVKEFVLARSGFEHTYNYESVVIHGVPTSVDNSIEKYEVLKAFIEGLYPDRWSQLKAIKDSELRATKVLKLDIENFACKVRQGAPDDTSMGTDYPVWAGEIPINQSLGKPIQDGILKKGAPDSPLSFVYLETLKRFEH